MNISEMKIEINSLEQTIKEMELLKKQAQNKAEESRKMALTCTCLGGAGMMLSPFVSPILYISSLITMFITITPSGFRMIHYEDKAEKLDKEISNLLLRIEALKANINTTIKENSKILNNIDSKENKR